MSTKLDRLKKRVLTLQNQIAQIEKRPQRNYDLVPREPRAAEKPCDFTIEFDGGTSSNNPKAYGNGYGSFQINGGEVHRVKFGPGHSCNSAEIRTLIAGLKELYSMTEAQNVTVMARGDSKIALKWVSCKKPPKESTSEGFRDAIRQLRIVVAQFKRVKTEWRGRAESVRLFGH